MADFVSLTCPSCNGKLQIGKDLDRFACGYCGTEFVVNRGGGVVSLSPVVEGLKRVERGVDRTASELAIARLKKEISKTRTELHEHQDMRKQQREQMMVMAVLLLPLGLFLLGIGSVLAVLSGLVLIAGGISGAYNVFRLFGESSEEKQLAAQLNEKEAELARHQLIVKA